MKRCEQCGAEFRPRSKTGRFCSLACFGRSRRIPEEAKAERQASWRRRWLAEHPDARLLKDHRPCGTCGRPFRPHNTTKGRQQRYCSRRCFGEAARRPAQTLLGRRQIHAPGHPLANSTGRVLAYRALLFERIGDGSHPCHWCGQPVTWVARRGAGAGRDELVVDHIDGDMSNNAPDNLVAACNSCNTLRALIRAWKAKKRMPLEALL